MADSRVPPPIPSKGRGFRVGEFLIIFVFVYAFAWVGNMSHQEKNPPPTEPGTGVAGEIGFVLGALVLSLILYGIHHFIESRRNKRPSQGTRTYREPSQPAVGKIQPSRRPDDDEPISLEPTPGSKQAREPQEKD